METRLRSVTTASPAARGTPTGRGTALALSTLIFSLTGIATWLGADLARRPVAAREIGDETMRVALEVGSADPEVQARLIELRAVLGRRPLDSMTRAVYSSLLLTMSRNVDDVDAAVYQARRAAELAPVTIPVLRTAVLVLAHTQNGAEAAALVRGVFDYEPSAAARWLERIEPLLVDPPAEAAIPDDPEAWLAWSVKLDLAKRHDEALEWVERGSLRWPDELRFLERAAFLAAGSGRWEKLAELLPAGLSLPDSEDAAGILVQRARLRARQGQPRAAADDLERALRLNPTSRSIAIDAGSAYLSSGDAAAARRLWTRVLFELGASDTGVRKRLLEQLARLEDEHGSGAAALRTWREVLELDPEHAAARRRIDDLTGFRR